MPWPVSFGRWKELTDEGPDETALRENIRRFNKMLDANNLPDSTRAKIWGLTMAGLLGIKVN